MLLWEDAVAGEMKTLEALKLLMASTLGSAACWRPGGAEEGNPLLLIWFPWHRPRESCSFLYMLLVLTFCLHFLNIKT